MTTIKAMIFCLAACHSGEPIDNSSVSYELPLVESAVSKANGTDLFGPSGFPVSIAATDAIDAGYMGITKCTKTDCIIEIALIIHVPIFSVIMHELGHAMGLAHVVPDGDHENVMAANGDYNDSLETMANQIAVLCTTTKCRQLNVTVTGNN